VSNIIGMIAMQRGRYTLEMLHDSLMYDEQPDARWAGRAFETFEEDRANVKDQERLSELLAVIDDVQAHIAEHPKGTTVLFLVRYAMTLARGLA